MEENGEKELLGSSLMLKIDDLKCKMCDLIFPSKEYYLVSSKFSEYTGPWESKSPALDIGNICNPPPIRSIGAWCTLVLTYPANSAA